MKKRYLLTLAALALGAGCALMQGVTGSDVMVLLLRPFTLLGEMLRAWSLSGAKGNLGAWAVVAVLSLLPSLYILIARRKRKQKSDWLFFLASAVVFGALFLLVNPTIYVHPMLTEARLSSPELLTGGPVFSMLSMLLLCLLARWTGGLMTLKKQERRLLFWTRALLISSMALIAFSTAFSAAQGAQAVWGGTKTYAYQLMSVESAAAIGSDFSSDAFSAWTGAQVSDPMNSLLFSSRGSEETSAILSFLLSCILLLPNLFSLWTLDSALSLSASMERGWFTGETDERATVLAVRARYALIAAVACMTIVNVLTVLLAQWIMNWNMSFSLPVDDLLISCGAMLLARLLSAACRVQQDNDLMI